MFLFFKMTTDEKPRLKFEEGKNYSIELYPTQKIVEAIYDKEHNTTHIFQSEEDYVLVDNHWVKERDGKITYSPFSSAPIQRISKQNANKRGGIEDFIVKFFGVRK